MEQRSIMTSECFLVSGSFLTSGWWQSQGGPFHFMVLLWACFEHVGSLESIPTPGMSITCFSLSTDSRQGTSKSLLGYGVFTKMGSYLFPLSNPCLDILKNGPPSFFENFHVEGGRTAEPVGAPGLPQGCSRFRGYLSDKQGFMEVNVGTRRCESSEALGLKAAFGTR